MSDSETNARRKQFWLLFAGLPLLALLIAGGWWFSLPTSTGPANGTALLGNPASAPTGSSLRLGTFNIDGGQGIDGIVDLSRTARCMQHLDFIGMNEVHGFAGTDPANQAEILSGLLHLPYLYVPAEHRWGHDSFGNAMFTDLSVQYWQRVVLPSAPLHALRNYLLTEVRWNDTTVEVLTTHTDWKTGGDEQLKIVSDLFTTLPTPAILMGDLNHTARDPQIEKLLHNPNVQEAVSTILGPDPKGRVDWIFLRGLTTEDAGSVDFGASDHPAYWAQVKLSSS